VVRASSLTIYVIWLRLMTGRFYAEMVCELGGKRGGCCHLRKKKLSEGSTTRNFSRNEKFS
jgi:hypothetical protein